LGISVEVSEAGKGYWGIMPYPPRSCPPQRLPGVIGKQKCSENGNCNAVKTGTGIQ